MACIRTHETKQRCARQGRQTLRSGLPSQGAHRRRARGQPVAPGIAPDPRSRRDARRGAECPPAQPHHRPGRTAQARARSLADWSADWLASQRVKVASGQLKAHARRVWPVAGPLRRAGAGTRADCGGDTRAARGVDRRALPPTASAEAGETCTRRRSNTLGMSPARFSAMRC